MTRRAASDKVLGDKAFNIAKNVGYDGYQKGLALMVCKLFDRKCPGATNLVGAVMRARSETLAMQDKFAIIKNQQLAEE